MKTLSRVKNLFILPLLIISTLTGCVKTAAQHADSLHSASDRNLTVGVVQRDIRVGMSETEVVSLLGSPNIVTRDKAGRDSWVYDKIATEASYSADGGSLGLILGAGGGGVAGALGGGYSRAAGAAAVSQRTLTVVIKFKEHSVESFTYHSSQF